MKRATFLLAFSIFTICFSAQTKEIQWLSFEKLEDSLKVKPKKTFIFFFADWCIYCKKMEQAAFKNDEIIQLLNSNFYAVKMNTESKETIVFDGKTYINKNLGKSRNPTHEIPLLLASRKNKPFSLPATIILDENFKIEKRYFEYLSPKKLKKILAN